METLARTVRRNPVVLFVRIWDAQQVIGLETKRALRRTSGKGGEEAALLGFLPLLRRLEAPVGTSTSGAGGGSQSGARDTSTVSEEVGGTGDIRIVEDTIYIEADPLP